MTKETQITVRLEPADAARAEALAAKLGGVTTRVAILREAMRLGLKELEQRYEALEAPAADPKPRKGRSK